MVIDERKEHILTNYRNAKTIRNFCYECGKDCRTKHAYRSHISIHDGLNKDGEDESKMSAEFVVKYFLIKRKLKSTF